jgi:hypothetical protein
MRYWIYDERTKTVGGPHLAKLLPKQPGFGPETKVAPQGARGPNEWKLAKDVDELKALFLEAPAPPASPPASPPAEKPKG